MASRHRKLLDESLPEFIATFCKENCAEPEMYKGTCPLSCSGICPDPYSCKLSIIPPPPPPPPLLPPLAPTTDAAKPHGGLSLPLTISLAVLATVFFLFTCYTIYKFYTVWKNSRRRRPRRQPEEEDGGGADDDFLDEEVVDHPIWYIRTIGLQPSVINAITIVKYKSADGLVEGTDCAVCLSEFQEDETLRLLPKCSHAFHIPCIDTWLASHTNCPMCRAGIVTNAPGPIQLHETPERHSGRAEEARPQSLGSETDIEFEGDNAALSQIRVEMSENGVEGDCKIDVDGLQPVRRSVSMDSLSASMISAAVASAFPRQSGKKKVEEVGNRSSSSMKRSASCSAKVFLSRHSSRR